MEKRIANPYVSAKIAKLNITKIHQTDILMILIDLRKNIVKINQIIITKWMKKNFNICMLYCHKKITYYWKYIYLLIINSSEKAVRYQSSHNVRRGQKIPSPARFSKSKTKIFKIPEFTEKKS